MAICLTCSSWSRNPLCVRCRRLLVPVGPVAEHGVEVCSGYRHETVARRLVHLLKYHGIVAAAVPLADAMAHRLPADTAGLIPVPRALVRRSRYGVDPAVELATRVSRITGIPVLTLLRSRLWWPAHAGNDRVSRRTPRFRLVDCAPSGALLVDDVLTTGVTLATAGELVGVRRAVTGTRACVAGFDRIGADRQQQRSSFAKSTR
ncbi:MAG: phosphoribosyltransferase family protein [Acidimicrobiia bacterium]